MKRMSVLILLMLVFGVSATAARIPCGVRVWYSISEKQAKFIDTHFDFVMTPFLSQGVQASFQNAQLFLYRSIQGTWTNFTQFDWDHINTHENMFCHTDSAV